MAQSAGEGGRGQAAAGPPLRLALLAIAALLAFAGFVALGNWQVHRRVWKLDLIRRVDSRLQAPPAAAPPRAQWPALNAADDEYRRLCLDGAFLHGHETLVQAVTRLGAGYWVLTPLQTTAGDTVLVNRGFVPPERRDPAARAAGQVPGPQQVCGLLRMSEPRGAFLHRNEPAQGRWYSRDVAAIAAAQGLPGQDVAPYFLDADAASSAGGGAGDAPGAGPAGGLTVVSFHNSHLVYALTWYALALMVAGAAGLVAHHEWRLRRPGGVLK